MAAPHSKRNVMKFVEGYIEHRGQDSKWSTYWCVLKDTIFYIFKTKETVKDNLIGSLELNNETQFIVGDSDHKKSMFKFELRTSRHLNKFKTKRYSERELWRGYIVGLTTGSVPADIDLMQGQLHMIEDDVRRFHEEQRSPSVYRRSSIGGGSLASGFSNPDGSLDDIFSADSTEMSSLNNGGPFRKHKFWMDPNRTDIPSWFFPNCTRELSEKILIKSAEFGNTLLRDCFTYQCNGSYTISKRATAERNPISHFEVIRVANGYKIHAENAPETFQCLSDVMSHFVHVSGAAATRLFITNDYKKLGIETPDYNTQIVKVDEDNGEQYAGSGAYVEPVRNFHHGHIHGSKTLPSKAGIPGFRPFQQSGTQAAPRDRIGRPGIDELNQNVAMAGALSNLDRTISSYDDGERMQYAYYNYMRSPKEQAPMPRESSDKVMIKTTRSRSEPFINLPLGVQPSTTTNLHQNVPITRAPGLVKVKRNESNRSLQNQQQAERNYPRDSVQDQPTAERQQFIRHVSSESSLQHNQPSDTYSSYYQNQEYVTRHQNASPAMPSQHDPYSSSASQFYQNMPNLNTPPSAPLSPVSPDVPKDTALLGDIQAQLSKLKPTGKSTTDIPNKKTQKIPPPVAQKTTNKQYQRRVSTGDIKPVSTTSVDINGNSKSVIEEISSTACDKEDFKKKLEVMIGGQKLPQPKQPVSVPTTPTLKSVPTIPLPPLPLYETGEETYAEIPTTDE